MVAVADGARLNASFNAPIIKGLKGHCTTITVGIRPGSYFYNFLIRR